MRACGSGSKKKKKRRRKREEEEDDDEAELDDEQAERMRSSLMEKRSTHFLARDDITEEELNERYRSQRRAAAGTVGEVGEDVVERWEGTGERRKGWGGWGWGCRDRVWEVRREG